MTPSSTMWFQHSASQSVVLGLAAAAASPGNLSEMKFQSPPQLTDSKTLCEWGPAISVVTSPPGVSGAPKSLETNVFVHSVPRTLRTGRTAWLKNLRSTEAESLVTVHEVGQ